MFCTNCGANIKDGSTFCTNCGANLGQNQANSVNQSAMNGNYGYNAGYNAGYNNYSYSGSTWDGSVFDTFVNTLVASLIMMCTCYIAMPWAMCYMFKFIASHTVINGKRLRFDGDGASLFGNWIVWMILTFVTCGIYSFWVAPRLYRWIASNTHFEE